MDQANYLHELKERIETWGYKLFLSDQPTERRSIGGPLLPDELTIEEHELLTEALQTTFAGMTSNNNMLSHCFEIDTLMYVVGTVRIAVRDLPSTQIVTWLTEEEAKHRETLRPKCKPFNEINIEPLCGVGDPEIENIVSAKTIVSELICALVQLREFMMPHTFFPRTEKFVPFITRLIRRLNELLSNGPTRELLMKYGLEELVERLVGLLKGLLHNVMAAIEQDYAPEELTADTLYNPILRDHTEIMLDRLREIMRELAPNKVPVERVSDPDPAPVPTSDDLKPYTETIETLGRYVNATSQNPPSIEIDLNKIGAQAMRDGVPRKYLVTMVVMHELIHALLDRLPYKAADCYIPEIDEAFAEYGMLHAVESLQDAAFMQYAMSHVYNKRFSLGTRMYSFGWELFLLSRQYPRLLASYYTRRRRNSRDESDYLTSRPTDSDKKALETLVEAFRASFPIYRAKAEIALKSITTLINLRTTKKDLQAAIDDCLAVSYNE